MGERSPVIVESMPLDALHAHPRNYRAHTDAQLAHITASLTTHGQYRPIVVARDNTILAGHGVALAAQRLGWLTVTVARVDIDRDDPRATKLLVGDNEIALGAEIDDRQLTELLKDLATSDDLLGSGYDAQQFAALVYVSRPQHEIDDFDAAAEWVGLPRADGEVTTRPFRVIVNCVTEEDRRAFLDLLHAESQHIMTGSTAGQVCSIWYPLRERATNLPRYVVADESSAQA